MNSFSLDRYFPEHNAVEDNKNQHSWIDERGNLWIVISKDEEFLKMQKDSSKFPL